MLVTEAVFVEHLGIRELVRFVLHWFFKAKGLGIICDLFVIHRMSRGAKVLAVLLRRCGVPVKFQELDYDFIDDVRLPGITSVLDYVYYSAAPELLAKIESDPKFDLAVGKLARKSSHEKYLYAYVSKRIFFEVTETIKSILVAAWHSQAKLRPHHPRPILYLEKFSSFTLFSKYASQWGVRLCPLKGKSMAWRVLARRLRSLLQESYFRVITLGSDGRSRKRAYLDGRPSLRVAAEMFLNGIGCEPIYNTEFFWYRKPNLPQGSVFGYFASPLDQPSEARKVCLKTAGIGWVDRVVLKRLMRVALQPSGERRLSRVQPRSALETGGSEIQRMVSTYIRDFYSDYERWRSFFRATGTRIHVSTFDIFPRSEALHAALADGGGVSISIQRSIEREPYIQRRTVTDVHFAFSRAQAALERRSGSAIEQFIVSGYLFDDAFAAAKERAWRLASQLRSRGATFTLCFLDENHGVVRKRIGGQQLTRQDYSFLCDRLAGDEALGVILKPKRPETLPDRLGPVWRRIQQFIDSGRCIFLGAQSLDDRYLPCVAACASDLAVSMLEGGTAGLESYLAGARTLMLRHAAHPGVFEKLPRGSVVFDTWKELWEAVERYRANPGDPQIGNWEPIIDQLASLRDGRASERIGKYITWLYEALDAGKSRDEALTHAARLYSGAYGPSVIEKISQPESWSLRGDHVQSETVRQAGLSTGATLCHGAVEIKPPSLLD